MTPRFALLLATYLVVLLAVAVPLGRYIARVFSGENGATRRVLGPIERTLYAAGRIDPEEEQPWQTYALALLAFSFVTHLVTYLVLRTQAWLPSNPTHLPNLPPWLAFNTTVGFETGTAWESFSGEATLSAFSQTVALVSQNFFSPAVVLCAAIALARGMARHESSTVGNAWVDLCRAHLYVLVPLSVVFALAFVSQGALQSWGDPVHLTTLDGGSQVLLRGPVASLEAIKLLGSNGEGYYNANSAHPWENPTPLCNFFQLVSILILPAALCFTLGELVKSRRHGLALFGAMTALVVAGAVAIAHFEQHGNPALAGSGVAQVAGNMEGKEQRFGVADSALFAEATTASSCGAVDSMHDSYSPLGGMVPMLNMELGEVVFGGTGSGLYGICAFVLLTVFVAGLLMGRMPEYLGKKIDERDIRLALLVILVPAFSILIFTALGVSLDAGRAGIANLAPPDPAGPAWRPHPHGLSEVLYAYSSASANNGSTFAGMTFFSPEHPVFYSLTLALAMYLGRYPIFICVLALAGNLAKKKRAAVGPMSFPVDGPLFAALLMALIVIVGALTFFPALALGPIVEHLLG
jgi:potassium-transporting ATPase potassium-binding subunit